MSLFRSRPPAPPVDPALIAAETVARIEAEQALARAAREREIADGEHRQRLEAVRSAGRAAARARRAQNRSVFMGRARTLAPILIVNAAAVYGQLDYAYREVAPPEWNTASSVALAVMFALAVESVALYVGWHAHDALLKKAHATAARLRRASYLIAGVVAGINYTHFADGVFDPTAAAVAFGLLSMLSPWLWGLHTRRTQHVQLLANDEYLLDESGAEFSAARRRAFPWRAWQARRWSIDHGVSDPRVAWREYNAERATRAADRAAKQAVADAERAAASAEKRSKGGAVAAARTEPSASTPAVVAAAQMRRRVRHRSLIRRVRVAHPAPTVSAAQDVRQDPRTAQDKEAAVRAVRSAMPGLSQSRIAVLTNLPPTTVRHVLRRTADVEVAPQRKTNGNVPALVGMSHDEEGSEA